MAKKGYGIISILPFVREESGRTSTMTIVRLTTRKPVRTAEQKTKTIIEAVSKWVKDTDDGKECWNQSCADLNIGDLACYDESFREWVRTKKNLNLVDLEILWGGEAGESMYFDRHLAEGIETEE